jgi:hypothetical protein
LTFKVAVADQGEIFNVIIQATHKRTKLGKIPLSKCCKMGINFQFTRALGGRILCMESLCSGNPLQKFLYDAELFLTLFGHPFKAPGEGIQRSNLKMNNKFNR